MPAEYNASGPYITSVSGSTTNYAKLNYNVLKFGTISSSGDTNVSFLANNSLIKNTTIYISPPSTTGYMVFTGGSSLYNKIFCGYQSVSANDKKLTTTYSKDTLGFTPYGIVFGAVRTSSSDPTLSGSMAEPFLGRIYNNTVYIYVDDYYSNRMDRCAYIIYGT